MADVSTIKGAQGMTPNGLMDDELDSIAWEFLESEFTGPTYAIWPIERRLEAYLLHRGLGTLADDGTVCGALLDRVMANIGPALQRGILDPPRCKERS